MSGAEIVIRWPCRRGRSFAHQLAEEYVAALRDAINAWG
jgi:hypothetical protein